MVGGERGFGSGRNPAWQQKDDQNQCFPEKVDDYNILIAVRIQ